MKHEGNLIIKKGDKSDYSYITSVGGNLYINSDAKLDNLASVGGYLYINSHAKLDNLTSVGWNLYINSDAKLDNLTSVGGYLYINSHAKLEAPFTKNLKYKSIDEYLFVIENTKIVGDITIYNGYTAIGVKDVVMLRRDCFVAEKGLFTAHGETVKKAIQDVEFKVIADKLNNEPIEKDTLFTVKYYRLLTGACDLGVRDFMSKNGIEYTVVEDETVEKDAIKAIDLLPILEKNNAYGVDKFKSLINW